MTRSLSGLRRACQRSSRAMVPARAARESALTHVFTGPHLLARRTWSPGPARCLHVAPCEAIMLWPQAVTKWASRRVGRAGADRASARLSKVGNSVFTGEGRWVCHRTLEKD